MTLASNPLVSTALPAPEGYYLDRSLAVKLDRLSASEISTWGIDAEEEIKPLLYPNRGADLAQIAAAVPGRTYAVSTASELLSANALAADNGGGKINVAAGAYSIGAEFNPTARTIIQGAGMGQTILRAGMTTSHFLDGDGLDYFVLRDLTLDANDLYLITAILRWGRHVLIERVEFKNSARLGFKFEHTRNITIRYCESHGMGETHGFSCKDFFGTGAPSASDLAEGNGKPGTFWSENIAFYSNYAYSCADNGFDHHVTDMEMAGNEARNNTYASKQPDGKRNTIHHNAFVGGEYGTRSYWSYTNSERAQSEIMGRYFDNIYADINGRFPHVNEKNAHPRPTIFTGFNHYVNCKTPPIFVNGATVYTDGASAPERTIAGVTAAPATLQAEIATLRQSAPALEFDTTTDGAPVAYSATVTKLEFATADTIRRQASGSDTWPLTWAADDALYGAGGDGVPPGEAGKLSMWFAEVDGGAENFTVSYIASDEETTGDGQNGYKMSGILAIGSTLYAWVRNRDKNGRQSALWVSTDSAATWAEAFVLPDFGYLSFIQFGKGYTSARDGYVYAVSPDTPSAYTPADTFVLLRAPQAEIANKSSYEVYAGLVAGAPTWSKSFAQRQAIFSNAGLCLRHGISYVAGIERYLWWQGLPGDGDERQAGGFGIYEAAEPWGPWYTVYFTTDWDVGPGETANFPVKWMSADGLTVYLSFSGEDALSVRKMTLTVDNAEAPQPDETTFTGRVAAGSDDAEESSGSVTVASADLDMGQADAVAIRFAAVDAPRDKTITRAVIRFTAASSKGAPVSLAIGAHDATDAPALSTDANGLTDLSLTSLVQWPNVRTWNANQVYESPDLASILNYLTNLPGWASGNAIAFVVTAGTGNLGGVRSAKSADNDATQAPELYIEWSDGSGITVQEATTVAHGESYATVAVDPHYVGEVAPVEHGESWATVRVMASNLEVSYLAGVPIMAGVAE